MVNQRMLNGGKQGEGSGLDADTVDAKESVDLSSELGKNVSLSEYRGLMNKLVSQSAENSFELGLQGINYVDGFYDVFVDSSKVGSTSNITVNSGTNGTINLLIDGLTQGNKFYNGGSSYTKSNRDSFDQVETIDGQNRLVESAGATLEDNSGYNVTNVLKVEFVYSDSTSESVQGEVLGDNHSENVNLVNPKPSKNVDEIIIYSKCEHDQEYTVKYAYAYDGVDLLFKSSGSFQSTTNDLGYQASKVVVTADYSLNGQSLDSIKVFDGADTELASFSESEIGTVKSISASRTDYYAEINLSGDGSDTPEVYSYEVALDDQ